MFKHRHSYVLMSALGAALSAGASAVAGAFDRVEEAAVTGLLRVTHAITEQVCEFNTVDEIENFLNGVADRHHWTRSDQPTAAPAEASAGTVVDVDLGVLRDSLKADIAAEDATNAAAQTPATDVGLPGNDAAPAAAPADTNTPAA